MGKLLPQGQPDVEGLGMAAIIRHLGAQVRRRVCLELPRRRYFDCNCRIFSDLLLNINSTSAKIFWGQLPKTGV
jgi:hypothetical protein